MNTAAWLKGNTHTHTTRSDGDAPLDAVARWYAERGYDFLAITDHNRYLRHHEIAAVGSVAVKRDNRAKRQADADRRGELDAAAERPADPLILIAGSELSYKSAVTRKPIDACSLGGEGDDPPGRNEVFFDGGPAATAQAGVDIATAAGGVPVVNHPCWRWALSADDLLAVRGQFLLEIFNPSSNCNSYGAGGADSPEDIWSKLLSAGRRVWAVAADDAHRFVAPGWPSLDIGGQAWVRVGAAERSADAILAALRAGTFYASTGVELADFSPGPETFSLAVAPVGDRRYTIRLFGGGGRELRVAHGLEASYRPTGDETFVRARVEDTEGRRCWTQPWFLPP